MSFQNLKNCTKHQLLMDPHQIHYLRFILEAYEGMALVSTIDRALGRVLLSISPGCEKDVFAILESEREHLGIRFVDFS